MKYLVSFIDIRMKVAVPFFFLDDSIYENLKTWKWNDVLRRLPM